MNPPTVCLHCGLPVPPTTTGRPRKFCKIACKSAWARKNGISSPQAADPTIASSDDFDRLPFEIAIYMPVQPGQSAEEWIQETITRKFKKPDSTPPPPKPEPVEPKPF
jgi:hypothetical protein